MGFYSSYAEAERMGMTDVWPGCGRAGLRMPCGRVHDYQWSELDAEGNTMRIVHNFRCWRNHAEGCPSPKPEPAHDFSSRGVCRRCGTIREAT